jgi:hypothetical protein
MTLAQLTTSATELPPDLLRFKHNKRIPKIIEQNVLIALSHYPELEHTPIRFVFKKNLKSNIMQAQPRVASFFKGREERGYQINISSMLRLMHSAIPIHQLPDNIMIGWIGHELGHVMDYEQRGRLGLISFGFTYLLSKKHRIEGETVADTFAVNHGLGKYIIDTKRFILSHAELPQAYKDKIARLYLSPDAIVEQVRKLEDKKVKAQLKALQK